MTYFAGRECEILYSLRLGNRAEDKPAWVVVTFTKDDRAEKIYTRHYQAPTPGQAMFLPSYRCLVEWFPSDWNLPSLRRATDDAAIGLLPAQASSHSQTPSDRRPHVEVLRYRPHLRCVIRYVPRSREEPVIGKVYPPGSKAAQAWNALCTLHAQAMVGITIPEPLALVEGWNLVL
ncbi:MAG: hypothetical protein DMG07_24870, partial [Acidobacteria bacterium]